MKINKTLVKILIFFLISLSLFFLVNRFTRKKLDAQFNMKIKSGNLATDYTIDQALQDIEKFDLNTINVPVVINVENLSSSTMDVDENSKARAIELIKHLNKQNINIILEPYPWIANGSEYETNWNPHDINVFFWNWKTNVLKILIDDIANPYHVNVLNIGTSFNHMEHFEEYWYDIIAYARKHYKGLITYRTSWWLTAHWDMDTILQYEAKLNNSLFSQLDFISIAAYFELTDNDTNSVEDLANALHETQIFGRQQNVKQEIKNFHSKWDKPIFFGELGFPRTIKASIHPWDPFQSNIINDIEQANCFEAYKISFENEPWLIGFSVFAIGENSYDKLYYPSDESTVIIQGWYNNVQ